VKLDEFTLKRIAERTVAGDSARAIAASFEISHTTVLRALKKPQTQRALKEARARKLAAERQARKRERDRAEGKPQVDSPRPLISPRPSSVSTSANGSEPGRLIRWGRGRMSYEKWLRSRDGTAGGSVRLSSPDWAERQWFADEDVQTIRERTSNGWTIEEVK
jgi:hypothetical protein